MTGSPDLHLPTRAAIMAALKASPLLADLVPKAQIYPGTVPATPAWPFTRFASMIASPMRATGLDTSAFRISIHGFSKGIFNTAGTLTTPAEDAASMIGSAIRETLDRSSLLLANGLRARLSWIQTTTMIDGDEAGAWVAKVIFNAGISA